MLDEELGHPTTLEVRDLLAEPRGAECQEGKDLDYVQAASGQISHPLQIRPSRSALATAFGVLLQSSRLQAFARCCRTARSLMVSFAATAFSGMPSATSINTSRSRGLKLKIALRVSTRLSIVGRLA